MFQTNEKTLKIKSTFFFFNYYYALLGSASLSSLVVMENFKQLHRLYSRTIVSVPFCLYGQEHLGLESMPVCYTLS